MQENEQPRELAGSLRSEGEGMQAAMVHCGLIIKAIAHNISVPMTR